MTALEARLGKALRRLRMRKGLTQKELAHLAGGMDNSQISAYERGAELPALRTLDRLLRVLGVDLVDRLEPSEGEDALPETTPLSEVEVNQGLNEISQMVRRIRDHEHRLEKLEERKSSK